MLTFNAPREKIAWFPTVNDEVCIGDQKCFNFCKNEVFKWDEAEGRPIVANPYKCVLGCDACMQICPVQAITFPSRQELRQMIRQAVPRDPNVQPELVRFGGLESTKAPRNVHLGSVRDAEESQPALRQLV